MGRRTNVQLSDINPALLKAQGIDLEEEQPKRSKFKVSAEAKKRTADGIVFDSEIERKLYECLRDLELFPLGKKLHLQAEFELQPGFLDPEDPTGATKVRPIHYVADFLIGPPRKSPTEPLRPDQFVIDVKGMILPEFKLKAKMFLYRYQRHIVPVRDKRNLMDVLLRMKLIDEATWSTQFTNSRRSSRKPPNPTVPLESQDTAPRKVRSQTLPFTS